MNRLREEMKLIPRVAWVIAIVPALCLALLSLSPWFRGPQQEGAANLRFLVIVVPIAIVLFFYVLLIGYIAADSRRRGMRPVLWVLLATFIPNMIGIILYFILRNPLLRNCSKCGASSSSNFAFCTSCGAAMANACPSCRSAVEPGWGHCPKCGSTLTTTSS